MKAVKVDRDIKEIESVFIWLTKYGQGCVDEMQVVFTPLEYNKNLRFYKDCDSFFKRMCKKHSFNLDEDQAVLSFAMQLIEKIKMAIPNTVEYFEPIEDGLITIDKNMCKEENEDALRMATNVAENLFEYLEV